MPNYFLDTTIVAELLLKPHGSIANAARVLLASPSNSALPHYAIKELAQGPMRAWILVHNALLVGGLQHAFRRINSWRRRANLVGSALEAMEIASGEARDFERELRRGMTAVQGLTSVTGEPVDEFDAVADRIRLFLQTRVLRAWQERRNVADACLHPLDCYPEVSVSVSPIDKSMSQDPAGCRRGARCAIHAKLLEDSDSLSKLVLACKSPEATPENRKRGAALHDIERRGSARITLNTCRAIGDAVFALQAPAGFSILTTNIKDHGLLAKALGKECVAVPTTI